MSTWPNMRCSKQYETAHVTSDIPPPTTLQSRKEKHPLKNTPLKTHYQNVRAKRNGLLVIRNTLGVFIEFVHVYIIKNTHVQIKLYVSWKCSTVSADRGSSRSHRKPYLQLRCICAVLCSDISLKLVATPVCA